MLGLTSAVLEVMSKVNVLSKNIKSANDKFRKTARGQSKLQCEWWKKDAISAERGEAGLPF